MNNFLKQFLHRVTILVPGDGYANLGSVFKTNEIISGRTIQISGEYSQIKLFMTWRKRAQKK